MNFVVELLLRFSVCGDAGFILAMVVSGVRLGPVTAAAKPFGVKASEPWQHIQIML